MKLVLGNEHAIEGYRDPNSENPEQVLYRELEGQRTTEINFSPGLGPIDAFSQVLNIVSKHFAPGTGPSWVEGDDEALVTLVKRHFNITAKGRPKNWGKK